VAHGNHASKALWLGIVGRKAASIGAQVQFSGVARHLRVQPRCY